MADYWSKILKQRLARRTVLMTGAGVALSMACSSDGSSSSGDSSGLLTPLEDRTKSAKRGGVYKGEHNADIQTFDPHFRSLPSSALNTLNYSRLLKNKPGVLEQESGEIIGDLAESWEMSPDRLQVTLKMRPNAHWSPLDPTKGRTVDANDVAYTWERFQQTAALRSDFVTAINPQAPIVSITAPDAQTVVVKLNEPEAAILTLLAQSTQGALHIVPREAQSGYDLRREQRGSGPWYLSEYTASSRYMYKRNPGYYMEQPYIDTLELPIITEYAQGLAQFKNGALYHYLVRAEDLLQTKKDVPELQMVPTPLITDSTRMFWGFRDGAGTPFRDERVRQAFSMAQNRELYIEVVYNTSKFTQEGLPLETRWNTALRAQAYPGWWLDPQSKDFGPNAKYYQYDPAEAKKLLDAAGYKNGLSADANYVTSGEYGPSFAKNIEVVLGMARDANIEMKTVPANFTSDWRPKFADANGNFDGMAFIVDSGSNDPGSFLFNHYHSSGGLFKGFAAGGKSTFDGDPKMDDLTIKMRREFDTKKRQALAHELQQYEAEKQYYPLFPGGASSFALAWPVLQNFQVYQGIEGRFLYEWIDETKAPLNRS